MAAALPGAALLDPAHAQHWDVVRTPQFLSADEIATIHACADSHREAHPTDGFATLYLQHAGVDVRLAPIIARIAALVTAVIGRKGQRPVRGPPKSGWRGGWKWWRIGVERAVQQ